MSTPVCPGCGVAAPNYRIACRECVRAFAKGLRHWKVPEEKGKSA